MTIDWIVPTVDDLRTVLSSVVLNPAADIGNPSGPTNQLALDLVVERWRGAIRTAGRIPVSLTAGSVPPEHKQHVLVLTVWQLVCSQPKLAQTVTEAFKTLVDKAEEALKDVDEGKEGATPSYPSDPDTTTASTGPVFSSNTFVDMTLAT